MKHTRILEISDEDLEQGNISNFKRVFGQLAPKDAKLLRGKIGITFSKYDPSRKDISQIDEVRRFIQRLDAEFPYFLYFLDSSWLLGQISLWIRCLLPSTHIAQLDVIVVTSVDGENLVNLLVERIRAIDRFCEQILDDSSPVIKDLLKAQPKQVATTVRTRLALNKP